MGASSRIGAQLSYYRPSDKRGRTDLQEHLNTELGNIETWHVYEHDILFTDTCNNGAELEVFSSAAGLKQGKTLLDMLDESEHYVGVSAETASPIPEHQPNGISVLLDNVISLPQYVEDETVMGDLLEIDAPTKEELISIRKHKFAPNGQPITAIRPPFVLRKRTHLSFANYLMAKLAQRKIIPSPLAIIDENVFSSLDMFLKSMGVQNPAIIPQPQNEQAFRVFLEALGKLDLKRQSIFFGKVIIGSRKYGVQRVLLK